MIMMSASTCKDSDAPHAFACHADSGRRIWLPLEGGAEPLVEDLVSDHTSYGRWGELPAVSPAARNNPDYRYVYGTTTIRPSPVTNQITKFDVKEKVAKASWSPDGGSLLGEPQVVQRPGATEEDDGVVIAPAVDGEGRCMVAVLHAGDLTELGRAYTPLTFPGGFHSLFVPPLATS